MKNNQVNHKKYLHTPQKEERKQEEKLSYSQILQQSAVENDFIHTPKIYIDIAGDFIAGVMLSRIIYWFSPSKNGNPRAQVEFGGNLWLVKTNEDWWEECRISLEQTKLAKNKLKRLGLIIIETHLFQNKTASHIRLNSERLEELYNREIQKMFSEGGKDTYRDGQKTPTYNNTLDKTLEEKDISKDISKKSSADASSFCPANPTPPFEQEKENIEQDLKKPDKIAHSEIVKLHEKEYKELCDKHGKTKIDEIIERITDYCLSKGKKYKNFAAAIRNWIRIEKDFDKQRSEGFMKKSQPTVTREEYYKKMSEERM